MRRSRLATVLGVGVAASALSVGLLAPPPAVGQDAADTVRVMHLTLDSLMPSEVGPSTPTLLALRDQATWWEQARGVMAAETLPNHVAMATGVYPERSGIPANVGRAALGDQALHEGGPDGEEDLGDPALLEAPSLVSVIEAACPDLRTVTVFSKQYVDNVFEADPSDNRFPQEDFNVPESGHAIDLVTTNHIQQELQGGARFDYLFANLGDIDRTGHIDVLGFTGQPTTRLAAIEQTDTLLGEIVATLEDEGLWESTVLIVSSDHGMDYSNALDPSTYVDVQGALDDDARTAERFFVAENGGAALVYLLDPAAPDADEVLAAGREVLAALDGVDEALYRLPNPLDPGLDLASVHPDWRLSGTDRAGELVVTVTPGHKFSTPLTGPSRPSNPIPGNHGHAATRHITAFVTGGWDGLAPPSVVAPSDPDAVDPVHFDDTALLPEQAEQVDFAPTAAWLLGVPDPGWSDGGPQWQGRVLEEAFARRPAARCDAAAGTDPEPGPTPDPGSTPEPDPLPATGGGLAVAGVAAALLAVSRRRWR